MSVFVNTFNADQLQLDIPENLTKGLMGRKSLSAPQQKQLSFYSLAENNVSATFLETLADSK